MAEFEASEANLRGYLQVVRRRLPWLLAITILVVAVAIARDAVQQKEYSATAQLLVQPASGTVPIGGTQQTVSSTDVITDLQLIAGSPVKAKVEKKLGFLPSVSAIEVGQTNVIDVTAAAPNPTLAADAANTYAKVFTDYQTKNAIDALTGAEAQLQEQIDSINGQLAPLEAEKTPSTATSAQISALTTQQATLQIQLAQLRLAGSEAPGGVEVVALASPPTSPSSPKLIKDAAIALAIGLLLGIAVAFAAEYFDDKIYTKGEVERLTGGVPTLALVPKVKAWRNSNQPQLITDADPFSHVTESYRSLRTSLRFAGHDTSLKTILITSASGAEGKTSTVANLGVVLARAGERVVVVACDLRRPRLGSLLSRNETPGFTTVVSSRNEPVEELKKALQPVAMCPGLALLATGPIPPNPTELLGSERAAELFRLLASGFDTVLIDSPPLLPVADAQVLTDYADAVLLVVMAGKTTHGEVKRATELLDQVGASPTGIVLNKVVRRSGSDAHYGYSGYGYKYRYSPHQIPEANGNGSPLRPAAPTKHPRRTGS